jgi:DNA-directed RNA polymerase omega subunit
MNNLYLEQAKAKISNPRILVNVAAQRATELAQRYKPLVEVSVKDDHNYLNIALLEIAAGMLTVETETK